MVSQRVRDVLGAVQSRLGGSAQWWSDSHGKIVCISPRVDIAFGTDVVQALDQLAELERLLRVAADDLHRSIAEVRRESRSRDAGRIVDKLAAMSATGEPDRVVREELDRLVDALHWPEPTSAVCVTPGCFCGFRSAAGDH